MATIELRGVVRRFGELTAVDDVTFDVEDGEIVGLLGHNGAGKTTLIRVINGLLTPDGGTVRVVGLDPVTRGREIRQTTGVLTEYPALDEFLTTRENLEVYAAINSMPRYAARTRIAELLKVLGLEEKSEQPARGLSAGLKQRVAIARALVHDPSVLLLDEPTTNMDPVAARGVRSLILRAVRDRGRTVLLSTHNLTEAEELCDRIGIMRLGRLLVIGTPTDLRKEIGGIHGARVTSGLGQTATVVAATERLSGGSIGKLTTIITDAATVEVTGTDDIPALVTLLVHEGVAVHGVEPIEPSLEDLYVALHELPVPEARKQTSRSATRRHSHRRAAGGGVVGDPGAVVVGSRDAEQGNL